MPQIAKVLIIVFSAIILLIIFSLITYRIIKKHNDKKTILTVEQLLLNLSKENPKRHFNKALKVKGENVPYDYVFYAEDKILFIKIIPNSGNAEICVNNSVKWQIRKSIDDRSLNFVPNVEKFMRYKITNDDCKDVKITSEYKAYKIFLIYPNARSLLRYINECEMEFVYPQTDVYGTRIITYKALNEHHELLFNLEEKEKNVFFK